MLGKADYPSLAQVAEVAGHALSAGGHFHYIDPEHLPVFEGMPVPDNVYTLAVALEQHAVWADCSPRMPSLRCCARAGSVACRAQPVCL